MLLSPGRDIFAELLSLALSRSKSTVARHRAGSSWRRFTSDQFCWALWKGKHQVEMRLTTHGKELPVETETTGTSEHQLEPAELASPFIAGQYKIMQNSQLM